MKAKGDKKTKPKLYTHIASAIIPTASIAAVPNAAQYFPQQKQNANEEWGPLAPTLIHASSITQSLIPSLTSITSQQENVYGNSLERTFLRRTDDEDEIDEDEEEQSTIHHLIRNSPLKNTTVRSESLSTNEDEDSTAHLDPKQALTAELSRSINEKSLQRSSNYSLHKHDPPSVVDALQSRLGPTPAKSALRVDTTGDHLKVSTTITPRSSVNDTTTVPASARSVSFKEPEVNHYYDSTSSKSHEKSTSVLNKIVLPPPEDYQQNLHDFERRTQLLSDENQQLRLQNRNLEKQHEDILDRLQTSQKLSQREIVDLLKQSGHDRTKDLENLNKTLQSRCEQLETELISLRDRYTQSQNQINLRELKNENNFLKDYIHRLNAASSQYQAMYPPKSSKSQIRQEQQKLRSLPEKGPSPIWLFNQKFLAPLFICYDEKLNEREEFIRKLQVQINQLYDQIELVTNENRLLHDKLSRSTLSNNDDGQLSDIEQIKRHALLVLEENQVLQEQLNLQIDQLTDFQKNKNQEISTLTRRLLMVESEKNENQQILETIRLRNEDLKRKHDQLMIDNSHRIHVQQHVHEITEMKQLTDQLSEKHANEMQLLLRRIQDAEAERKITQIKLNESRIEIERFKGEIKAIKKTNKKSELQTQITEQKLEIQRIQQQNLTTMLDKTQDEFQQTKIERDTYLALAKAKEAEINKAQTRSIDDTEKLNQLEERLEIYKNKNKERVNEAHEQMKKQCENLKLRCLEYEQRVQQLIALLKEKQIQVDNLDAEKRNLEVDLETIWQANNADRMNLREHLLT